MSLDERELQANIHPVDRVPKPHIMTTMAIQHLLTMYTGAIAVPLVLGAALDLDPRDIGFLISMDLFICGISTVLQSIGVVKLLGVRLPVISGAAFASVSPMIIIGDTYGLPAIWGSLIAAGIFGLAISWWFSKLIRYFPSVVAGTIITVIGVSLIGVGVGLVVGSPESSAYASTTNLSIALAAVVFILLTTALFRGFAGRIAVLLALVIGTIVLAPFGFVDLTAMREASWFGFVTPFHFGSPTFPLAGVITMCVIMIVTFTESSASVIAVGDMVDRPADEKVIFGGVTVDALSSLLGGVFNSFMNGIMTQNIGLVALTRVRSRWVTATAGVLMVIIGFIPKIGALVAGIPSPLIGGVSIILFGQVAVVGIRRLTEVQWEGTHNALVAGIAISIGLFPSAAPDAYQNLPHAFQVLFGNAIVASAIVAFVLNLFLNEFLPRLQGREGALDSDLGKYDWLE